jgi:hypothetical protein
MRALAIAIVGAALFVAACTKKDPLYCGSSCDAGNIDETRPDGPTDTGDTGADTGSGCNGDQDCAGMPANKRACDVRTHACVQCTRNDQCGTDMPICRADTCGTCQTDGECGGPGVCMENGRCAVDGDVIYVQKTNNTCTTGSGTMSSPYCRSQDAVKDLAGKTIIIVRPSIAVGGIDINSTSLPTAKGPILIVGQQGALIMPGSNDPAGVHVSGAFDVTVRDLKIANGNSTGIAADSGATVHVTRCYVEGNAGGGILLDGAGYEITNTIIAANSAVSTQGCGAWGGVCIRGTVPIGAPSTFQNDTVASNAGPGVACMSSQPIGGSIVYGNATLDNSGCAITTCCGPGDPLLDPTTYHLLAGSPCIDKLDPASAPAVDIDDQPRPQAPAGTSMPKSDCGADEYVPPPPPAN